MQNGMFFGDTVVNIITVPKFVPVLLQRYEQPIDLPSQLLTSKLFQLQNLDEFKYYPHCSQTECIVHPRVLIDAKIQCGC